MLPLYHVLFWEKRFKRQRVCGAEEGSLAEEDDFDAWFGYY